MLIKTLKKKLFCKERGENLANFTPLCKRKGEEENLCSSFLSLLNGDKAGVPTCASPSINRSQSAFELVSQEGSEQKKESRKDPVRTRRPVVKQSGSQWVLIPGDN